VVWRAENTRSTEAPAWTLESEREWRGYVLLVGAAELSASTRPDVALRGEMRMLSTPVNYDVVVNGQPETTKHAFVAAGFGVELSAHPPRKRE